jgi:hypothetical protein
LEHSCVDLADAKRVDEVRTDRRETDRPGLHARLIQQEQEQSVIRVPEAGHANGPTPEVLHLANDPRLLGRYCEREERKPACRQNPADARAVRGSLECHIEGGPSIVNRATNERLHRGVPSACVDQLDIKPLICEVAARPRHLIRNDAKKLTAER